MIVKFYIRFAAATLLERDIHLLQEMQTGTSERSVVFHFAGYLTPLFGPLWDVDVEYNRNVGDIKRDIQGTPRIPDIIIHKRGSYENLVIFESKKWPRNPGASFKRTIRRDMEKLYGLMCAPALNYRFACYLLFCPTWIDAAFWSRRDGVTPDEATGELRRICPTSAGGR